MNRAVNMNITTLIGLAGALSMCAACTQEPIAHDGEAQVEIRVERTSAPGEAWKMPLAAFDLGLQSRLVDHVATPIDDPAFVLTGLNLELQTMSGLVFSMKARDNLITAEIAGIDSTVSLEYSLQPLRLVITDPLERVVMTVGGVHDPKSARRIVAHLAILSFGRVAHAEHGANHASMPYKDQDCPATSPGTANTSDDWCLDNVATHGDADACYRGYGKKAGNQCCYDKDGKLITTGSGAGTADRCGPAEGENKDGTCNWSVCRVIGHFIVDVIPSLWPF